MARRLVAAGNRDDVADALIEYLGAHYARAVLFMVVAGQVTGWRAMKNHQPIPAIDQFQLPLSEPSVLKTAVESNSFFLGPVSPSGANLALTTLLGKPAPTTAVLLPLAMLGRVVGLVYVDDPAVNMPEAVADMQKVAGKALLAFELLILHKQDSPDLTPAVHELPCPPLPLRPRPGVAAGGADGGFRQGAAR